MKKPGSNQTNIAEKNKESLSSDSNKREKISTNGNGMNSQNVDNRIKIKFNIRTGYVFVNPIDIVYCSADSNYTHIFFTNQKQLTVSLTLSNVSANLPAASFIRISRSTIININFLSEIKRTEKICLLNAAGKVYSFRISPKSIKALISDLYH